MSAMYVLKQIEAHRDAPGQAKAIMRLQLKTALIPEVTAFLREMLDSDVPVLRFAAAGVLARALHDGAPDKTYERLRQVVVDPVTTMPGYRELDMHLRELVSEACVGLACIDRRRRENIDLFTSILDRRSDARSVSADAAHLLLQYDFEQADGQGQRVPEELTPEQRAILAKLLSSRRPWTEGKDLERSLHSFGLPKTRDELAEFLARSEASA